MPGAVFQSGEIDETPLPLEPIFPLREQSCQLGPRDFGVQCWRGVPRIYCSLAVLPSELPALFSQG